MKKLAVLVLSAGALLAGCGGGGGGGSPPPTSEVPASASASVGGFIAYIQALISSNADLFEPVDVSGVTPPTDDLASPTPID